VTLVLYLVTLVLCLVTLVLYLVTRVLYLVTLVLCLVTQGREARSSEAAEPRHSSTSDYYHISTYVL